MKLNLNKIEQKLNKNWTKIEQKLNKKSPNRKATKKSKKNMEKTTM